VTWLQMLMDSDAVHKLMALLLALGNYMNSGMWPTHCTEAYRQAELISAGSVKMLLSVVQLSDCSATE